MKTTFGICRYGILGSFLLCRAKDTALAGGRRSARVEAVHDLANLQTKFIYCLRTTSGPGYIQVSIMGLSKIQGETPAYRNASIPT